MVIGLGSLSAADTIIFNNGAKLSGTIKEVHSASKTVTINLLLRGRTYSRKYSFKDIRSVTRNGQTRSLGQSVTPSTGAGPSEAEIDQRIRTEGAAAPAWLTTTKLNYPATMDLNWPLPAPKPWNGQKNIGQFLWDTINPNQNRWREGVRFLLFLIDRHQNNSTVRNQATKALASMYFRLFQDYPRAAYWWRRSNLQSNDPRHVMLAECYFRMGSPTLAMKSLAGKAARTSTVKLLGAMGETDRATRLAEAIARSSSQPHETFLVAGDALAFAGRYPEAISYYNKVLTDKRKPRNKQYEQRYKSRARETIAAINLFKLMDVSKLRDGTYTDQATGYNGALRVKATVATGRISGLQVTSHKEKQYYAALRDIPWQIMDRQSVKDIDATSRATITAQAIVNATAKALAKGR